MDKVLKWTGVSMIAMQVIGFLAFLLVRLVIHLNPATNVLNIVLGTFVVIVWNVLATLLIIVSR